ncbi:hypothetical protein GUJ93_ZPchr0005g14940 [Zizania palustris]|uniref:Uncharacterized protein n=1 Tax=Zizania palustris TaxID=103762 RepID=A0A8J5T7B7_ZIZPA|nr:hypothetical protein GUJ93_ZPchr0005g14940 [Zizania palustris]
MASARAGAALLRGRCLAGDGAGANPALFSGHGLLYRKLDVILTTVLRRFISVWNELPTPLTKDEIVSEATQYQYPPRQSSAAVTIGIPWEF